MSFFSQHDNTLVGALGNVEYPFIAIGPKSTLAQIGSTW